jgi:hypothetical protein
MKSRKLMWFITSILLAVLAIPVQLAAQEQKGNEGQKAEHNHYKLVDTGTLGGPTSSLGFEGERDINNRGTLVSTTETTLPDPFSPNCFLVVTVAQSGSAIRE